MANDTEKLPPHKAVFAIVFMNAALWAVGYAVVEAVAQIYRLAKTVLP